MSKVAPFYLDTHLEQNLKDISDKKDSKATLKSIDRIERFFEVCEDVQSHFDKVWKNEQGQDPNESEALVGKLKRAILGYQTEVSFYMEKIESYLTLNSLTTEWFPSWYSSLATAIFHENWGIAGVAEWKTMKNSSSCKIIGNRIYFLINGEQKLMPQNISTDRLNRLRKALLSNDKKKREADRYTEVYQLDGTRITIFAEGLAKETTIVFRKYTVEEYTFDEQAKRGTIPKEVIPMFKAMVNCGFNVCMIGPVRSAKTTFLSTWQSYENPKLEGVQVETDPEIPQHKLMPFSPIMQLVADGDDLKKIMKSIKRSDADYIIMAEARDGTALKIAVDATQAGTRRVKSTFHSSDPVDFVYDAATEIINEFGGEVWPMMIRVAKGYNYLFEFMQLPDKSKKRLNGIYEIRYNPLNFEVTVHQICKYNFKADNWSFKYDIGDDKQIAGMKEDVDSMKLFESELKRLEILSPITENHVFQPAYSKLISSRG